MPNKAVTITVAIVLSATYIVDSEEDVEVDLSQNDVNNQEPVYQVSGAKLGGDDIGLKVVVHQQYCGTSVVEVIVNVLVVRLCRELIFLAGRLIIDAGSQLPALLGLDIHVGKFPDVSRRHDRRRHLFHRLYARSGQRRQRQQEGYQLPRNRWIHRRRDRPRCHLHLQKN